MQSALSTSASASLPAALPRKRAHDGDPLDAGWRMLLVPVREVGGLEVFERRPAIEMDSDSSVPHAVGIMYVEPNGKILLVRRSDEEATRAGYWNFPGGRVDAGESPKHAAARESAEEVQYEPDIADLVLLNKDRDRYYTYKCNVVEEFEPVLNSEHDDWQWAAQNDLPSPLHPGVERLMAAMGKGEGASDEASCVVIGTAVIYRPTLAIDRQSVRSYDADGRLHVALTPISKAIVNPYWGREIPGHEDLGLDANKQYRLLRHPDELAKAAPTFNNLPILSKHVPISVDDHQPDLVIGSTGTDAKFDKPYLWNSLVFWVKAAIDEIESEEKKELSCAYRYKPDMTPGTYEGQRYDGVMRDIVANHLAHVKEGRAGPDVVVGDSKLDSEKEKANMAAAKPLSRMATLLMGASYAHLQSLLAKDEKINLQPIFRKVTPNNIKGDGLDKLVGMISRAVEGKLAIDATPEGLHVLLEALSKIAPKEDEIPAMKAEGEGVMPAKGGKESDEPVGLEKDADPDEEGSGGAPSMAMGEKDKPDMGGSEEEEANGGGPMDEVKAFIKANMSPEAYAKLEEMMKAAGNGGEEEEVEPAGDEDGPPAFEGKPMVGGKDKRMAAKDNNRAPACDKVPAMDEDQVKKMIEAATAAERKKATDTRAAEQFVFPYVGRLAHAFDSAETIYREALKVKGLNASEVKEVAALRLLLSTQSKLGDEPKTKMHIRVASDSASVDDYHKMFGNEQVGFA